MPSEAQKEAGNYSKDRLRLHGLPITIENRKGTVRTGKDREGRPWSVVLPYHYGYIRRTLGADGDQVDAFIGPRPASQFVVIVNQHDRQTGKFDEIKVGLGYDSLEQAKAAYRQGYRGRNVPQATFKTTTIQRLKKWLQLKQTWAAFDMSARVERLTAFRSNMKRVVMFRRQQEEEPSTARKVMKVLAPVAVIGGTLAYKHINRAKVPTEAINPTDPSSQPRGHWGSPAPEARILVTGDPSNPRSNRWITKSQHAGTSPMPKDSVFYEAPPKRVSSAPKPSKPAAVVSKPAAVAKVKAVLKKAVLKKPVPLRTSGRKILAAIVGRSLIEFNNTNAVFNNLYGASDRISTAYRTGRRIVPWVKRGGKVAEDTADIASGKKVKDPFYKSAWFKSAAVGAGIGLPILAARKVNAWHQQDKSFPNSVSAMSPTTGHLKEKVLRAARKIDAKWVAKNPTKRRPLLTNDAGPFFAAKIKNPILLQAVLRHVQLSRIEDDRDRRTGAAVGALAGGAAGFKYGGSRGARSGLRRIDILNAARSSGAPSEAWRGVAEAARPIHVNSKQGAAIIRGAKNDGRALGALLGVSVGARAGTAVADLLKSKRKKPEKEFSTNFDMSADQRGKSVRVRREKSSTGKKLAIAGTVAGVGAGAYLGGRYLAKRALKTVIVGGVKEATRSNKVRNFDSTADERGWDLRDARGKSARVYAPGSRKRVRREKDWGEKTDNIRAVRNAAIVGTLGGVASAIIYRNRAQSAGKAARDRVVGGIRKGIESGKITINRPTTPPNVTQFPKIKRAAAIVRTVDLARRGGKPLLTEIISSTKKNVKAPEISIPGQSAVQYINQLPPKKRAGVLRVLGATATAGAGTVAGMALGRPKTGALLGGFAAARILK